MRGLDLARRRCCRARRGKQSKTRRARARHAREAASGRICARPQGPLRSAGQARLPPVRGRCRSAASIATNAVRFRGTADLRIAEFGIAARYLPIVTGEYVLGRERDARIDEHHRELRDANGAGQNFADAAHRRADADRGTPAHRRRFCARPCECAGHRDFRRLARASRRSAAAASAEPPPSPAATGRFLTSVNWPSVRPSTSAAQQTRGLEHQIVGQSAGSRGEPGRAP